MESVEKKKDGKDGKCQVVVVILRKHTAKQHGANENRRWQFEMGSRSVRGMLGRSSVMNGLPQTTIVDVRLARALGKLFHF